MCPLNSLQIVQRNTGQVVAGKPLWRVEVINNCICDQSQIMLSCNGFQSFEGVDPLILKKIGDNCLLYNGHLLSPRNIDVFAYASDSSFPFVPVSSLTGTCHQKVIVYSKHDMDFKGFKNL